jgi:hypothetical protein
MTTDDRQTAMCLRQMRSIVTAKLASRRSPAASAQFRVDPAIGLQPCFRLYRDPWRARNGGAVRLVSTIQPELENALTIGNPIFVLDALQSFPMEG